MNHFDYRDGVLCAEDVPLPRDRRGGRHAVLLLFDGDADPPFQRLRQGVRRPRRAGLLCHEGQFQPGRACKLLGKLGAGADVVSEGELRRALAAGIPPAKIMFSGVGKTAREMDFALAAGIHCFNVESEPELELLSARAVAAGSRAPISVRINPDVDAKTHRKIATGKAENKFGIAVAARPRRSTPAAAALPGIRVVGIDTHIGSQITELQPFDDAFALLVDLVGQLRADGHAIEHIDLGGGLGIPYRPDNDAAAVARRLCGDRPQACHRARAQGDLRAGPPDRRQCRHPGLPR